MADGSHIEWTDATWNPVTGCSVVSPGCTNCYAMRLAGTRLKDHPSRVGLTEPSKAGPVWNGAVRLNAGWLDQPLRWKRPRRIFVCAHGDLFHEAVPDAWIDQVFAVMTLSPRHTFQVLTKRAARMRAYMEAFVAGRRTVAAYAREIMGLTASTGSDGLRPLDAVLHAQRLPAVPVPLRPLSKVWLGVSVEDQVRADERIPDLLATPAAKRFISAEPLLGPIDISWTECTVPGLDWVIAGGESGKGARPMHPDWARSLRDQCAAAGVPFFFKQWGEWGPDTGPVGHDCWPVASRDGNGWIYGRFLDGDPDPVFRYGKRAAGALLDGALHRAFPA